MALLLTSCAVGPDYHRPSTAVPAGYKSTNDVGAWKEGSPLDNVPKGTWWEIFGDQKLNDLESEAAAANQELKAAMARVEQARATARVARSELFPSLNADPSFTRQRYSPNQVPSFGGMTANTWSVPLDLSYEIDLWGRVRRGFESARADAQASLAAFHNILLTLQADIARNYFTLRALDAELTTVTATVELRHEQVRLVRSRFEGGIGNELDLARAETELATTEADAASLGKPCDPHRRTRPRGNHPASVGKRRVDVEQVRAGPRGRPPVRCDRDGMDARDVDDHAARRGVAAVAVAPRARNDADVVPARPAHGLLHVGERFAKRDRPRSLRPAEARRPGPAHEQRQTAGATDPFPGPNPPY